MTILMVMAAVMAMREMTVAIARSATLQVVVAMDMAVTMIMVAAAAIMVIMVMEQATSGKGGARRHQRGRRPTRRPALSSNAQKQGPSLLQWYATMAVRRPAGRSAGRSSRCRRRAPPLRPAAGRPVRRAELPLSPAGPALAPGGRPVR